MLAKETPALFRDLPESFKVSHPLPQKMVISPQPSPGCATLTRSRPLTRPSRAFASQIPFTASQAAQVSRSRERGITKRGNHHQRFVHGCELLTA
jgi:hypothetical protein